MRVRIEWVHVGEPHPRAGTGTALGLIDRLDKNLAAWSQAVMARDEVDPDTLAQVTQRFEAFRNRLPAVDHRLIVQIDRAGLAEKHCVPSTQKLLAQLLRIGPPASRCGGSGPLPRPGHSSHVR